MSRIRDRLTYANVMSTVAVFVALGGASYAAFKVPANSVGTKQLKSGAVTGAKIHRGAVSAADIGQGSLQGNLLADGSLTGKQINAGTLGTVPNATHAGSADSATNAGHATNSDQLGGLPAASYLTGPAEAWHEVGSAGNPSFGPCSGTDNWQNFGSTESTAAFFRDQAGIVHLKGTVKCPTSNTITGGMFTLPAGYRPAANSEFLANYDAGTANTLEVLASGQVATEAVVSSSLSLDGISFRCGPSGSNGCP
jgi:hypothetical protein